MINLTYLLLDLALATYSNNTAPTETVTLSALRSVTAPSNFESIAISRYRLLGGKAPAIRVSDHHVDVI